ncbi:NUDIX domain-containing protein [Streptomyces sp. NPDC052077]|uniref:NUDIX hydrolase n=1 Tax=Streptomyces sp. NPDC052077 TaxID=3154757 RepID=UPI0034223062
MTQEHGASVAQVSRRAAALSVVAAAVVQDGRLLVVSKRAAPDVFYLPGGKPEAGEEPSATLARELDEELGVEPLRPRLLARIDSVAVLERVPMRLTLFAADIDRTPRPAAEIADIKWITGRESGLRLSPALTDHVLPLLARTGSMAP